MVGVCWCVVGGDWFGSVKADCVWLIPLVLLQLSQSLALECPMAEDGELFLLGKRVLHCCTSLRMARW